MSKTAEADSLQNEHEKTSSELGKAKAASLQNEHESSGFAAEASFNLNGQLKLYLGNMSKSHIASTAVKAN
jgi:hypothetical protein